MPAFDKISYSIIGDPTAAVQALTNEEIDVISPQATADIYQAVSGAGRPRHRGARPATVAPTSTSTSSSPTAARSTRRSTAATPRRRSRCGRPSSRPIPRQEIVDRLIKPINPEAVLRESFIHGARRAGLRHDRRRRTGWTRCTTRWTSPAPRRCSPEAGVTTPDRRPAAVRGQQPAPVERVRPDEGLRAAGRLQPHRRPGARAGARCCRPSTATTPRCSAGSQHLDRRCRGAGELTSPTERTTTASTPARWSTLPSTRSPARR